MERVANVLSEESIMFRRNVKLTYQTARYQNAKTNVFLNSIFDSRAQAIRA